LNTITALDTKRFDVDLIVGADSDLNLVPPDIEVLKVQTLVRGSNPIKNIRALFDLYMLIRKGKYQIVHTHQANAGIVGRIASKFAGVPVIIHGLHGSTFHQDQNFVKRRFYILLEKISAKITTVFTVVGHDLRNRYLNEGIGKKKDFFIIRSGMELERFYEFYGMNNFDKDRIRKELGFKKDEFLIGAVAALEPRKGHIYLIEIARRLKNENVKFLFVGWGIGMILKKL
jgi:glycosyltransferase involved in cell wall biosynthesis